MLDKIYRVFRYLKLKKENKDISEYDLIDNGIFPDLIYIKNKLDEIFINCSDFVIREVRAGKQDQLQILIVFIDGLVDNQRVNRDIIFPLRQEKNHEKAIQKNNTAQYIKEVILNASDVKEINSLEEAVNNILGGDTLIFIEGGSQALSVDTKGWEMRGVEEPDTESVVRGPREGFTETLRVNTALLRRKIKNPNFKFEHLSLGRQTNTDIAVCYIKGLIHEDILRTLKRRLKKIKVDSILESGYIEEFIEDAPLSIFSTVGNTEKPDVAAGKLLEGRAAVIVDGTPFVLTVPHLFIENLMSSEDYYHRYSFSTMVRILRVLALFITVLLPAFYVAMVAFHQDVIPFKLLLTIAASREGIPFTVFTETLLMAVTFELLREGGVRMPRPIGQAVSIVGGLVLGQSAVEAGIASNPVIMLTALTAISSFVVPKLNNSLPIIRFFFLAAANFIGLTGISLVAVVLIVHMCTIRSFGIPYLVPFSPFQGMDLKDTFLKAPLWLMWFRPKSMLFNESRQGRRMKKDLQTKED